MEFFQEKMQSVSIIRYYVNVATGSLFWHKQYEGAQMRTAYFCSEFMLGVALLLAVWNEVE